MSGGDSGGGGSGSHDTPRIEAEITTADPGLTGTAAPPGPETKSFKLNRRFYQCMVNVPRHNEVDEDSVELNWYNVPWHDQRFYWTPRDLGEVLNSGDLIKVENLSFSMSGFHAMFNVEKQTDGQVKIEAKPTHDPKVWTYIDSSHKLPWPDYHSMDEKTIKSNLVFPKNKDDCLLKLWTCKNTSVKDHAGNKSTNPKDFYFWPEDLEIVNQRGFREIGLSDSFSFSYKFNMPWLLMNQNMVPLAHPSDSIGPFTFPNITNGRIDEISVPWSGRSFNRNPPNRQESSVKHQLWSDEIPNCLIKPFPFSTHTDEELPYTIWFVIDYEAHIKVRKCNWVYGHSRYFHRKHPSYTNQFGLGKQVTWSPDVDDSGAANKPPDDIVKV